MLKLEDIGKVVEASIREPWKAKKKNGRKRKRKKR